MPPVQQPYAEINVTGWSVVGDEALGTKPKRWLKHPETGERWLMKDTTYNKRSDGTRYRKGDDWSERIATGVAGRLGLPAARTELAVTAIGGDLRYGVISKSVLAAAADDIGDSEEELVDGNELLLDPVIDGDRTGYTIEAVRDALTGVEAPAAIDGGLTAWDVFVGYLILDALVGNTDRHEENWAVIDRARHLSLAPTFDHASCLGFQLDDHDRQRRLHTHDSGFAPEAWADRAKSPFAGRPHPVVAAVKAMAVVETRGSDRWIDRCGDVDSLVEPVWMIPKKRISQPARQFAERVLRRNCRRLLAGPR